MKKFLALAAVLAFTNVHAAEDLVFGDLNYFLKAGAFNAGADVIVNNENGRMAKTVQYEVDNYLVNSHFGYAFSDRFNVVLGLDYILDSETEVNKGRSADSQGLQNPKLGANLRALRQQDFGINLDFGAVVAYKFEDRKAPVRGHDGNTVNPLYSNYTDPRNSVELNARIGRKWNEANEFYLIGGAIYHADGEFNERGSSETNMDSSVDFKLGGAYQYRPVHEFMLTVGLNATRVGDIDGDDGQGDLTIGNHIDYQFNFGAKYLITESTIVKFIFTKDRRDKYDVERKGGNPDVKFDKRNAEQYGLGVDFLF